MGHRSATVVVYFVGTRLTWGRRVLGEWTWAVCSWAFYLWSLVLGFGLVYLRRRHPLSNSDIIPFVQHQPKVLDLTWENHCSIRIISNLSIQGTA